MALVNPRRLVRPSLGSQGVSTVSSPSLGLSVSAAAARNASYTAHSGLELEQQQQQQPLTPQGRGGGSEACSFAVGDLVDVPGGMHGTVKFVGNVQGKNGLFAGVELGREYATRGKNDGDVDGVRYFRTSIPRSGIFLPVHRASKRTSPSASSDRFPPTPPTPTMGFNQSVREARSGDYTPSTAGIKFSQSLGPAARPTSPAMKLKARPSFSQPESPSRKVPTTTPGRARGVLLPPGIASGIASPRASPSPVPGRPSLRQGRTPSHIRPYSRSTNSRLGSHMEVEEDEELTPVNSVVRQSSSSTTSSLIKGRPSLGQADGELHRLKELLQERDGQLKDQAALLADMEASLSELQTLIPSDSMEASFPINSRSESEETDAAQLRALLQEKNERISILTAEFDAHRADFRSTIDTLEMASTETERVYEKRIDDLTYELNELYEKAKDVQSITKQFNKLETQLAELEEYLEEARRGEAEARGEVEFLRGEVERGRAELRREREKALTALKLSGAPADAADSKDMEQRNDEIRGLKAIIHSFSSGKDFAATAEKDKSPMTNGVGKGDGDEPAGRLKDTIERLEREKDELRGLVEPKAVREEELEREIERLQMEADAITARTSYASNAMSERTLTLDKRSSAHDSQLHRPSWTGPSQPLLREAPLLTPTQESDTLSSAEGSALWCELCDSAGHNVLDCTSMLSTKPDSSIQSPDGRARNATLDRASPSPRADQVASALSDEPETAATPAPRAAFTLRSRASGPVGAKESGEIDVSRWCANCEHDGHDSVSCPFEETF